MTDEDTLKHLTNMLLDAVGRGTLVKLTLSKPTPTAGDLKSVDIRPIMVKRALKLSFTHHHKTRDVVKNHPPAEAADLIAAHLQEHFRAAYLTTTQGDLQLSYANGSYRSIRHASTATEAPTLTHDRAKQRPIDHVRPYLHALGITDASGAVYKTAQDKYRQINKYIESVDALLRALPPRDPLRIVDMGAGKGYLTFALYDHLTHTLTRRVEMTGVEVRAELVAQGNSIAHEAGFGGLRFVEGTIDAYDCSGVDVVIALHACDTATDDAIAKALKAGAQLIVVAPCCHKQVRRAMEKPGADHPLSPMLQFGTYTERLAEMLTDTLRAMIMERQGYKTNLFEFIADAHTPKNVMIVATRLPASSTAREQAARESIARLKAEFGLAEHYLETRIGA